MTWPERLNFWGLILQLGGVLGIILWYLARVHELSEGGLPGKVARLLVRLRLRPPPPPPPTTGSIRQVLPSLSGGREPRTLSERVDRLTTHLEAYRDETQEWQREHEQDHGAAAVEQEESARQSEHNAALIGAGSSFAIVLGLGFQIAAALGR